jgi:hypothetical protein
MAVAINNFYEKNNNYELYKWGTMGFNEEASLVWPGIRSQTVPVGKPARGIV